MGYKNYLHEYDVALTPISKKTIDFTTDNIASRDMSVKEFIKEKLIEFSDKSKDSVYNAKEVDVSSLKVTERVIYFKLYSMEPIDIIGRSVRLFSQLVLEDSYFENLLIKKKLFTTFMPTVQSGNGLKTKIVDIASVSDAALVKGLVDLLVMPEYKIGTDVREAIGKIKLLAVESGIVKIN